MDEFKNDYSIEDIEEVEATDSKEQLQILLEENVVTTDSVQLNVSIPKRIYELIQQNNSDVRGIFQESFTIAILLAQNQDLFEEVKVEIMS
ncbi:hypothetical protein AB6A23_20160 [Paenibacillus tarimensis]